jgi:hypothetical protein
MIYKSSGQRIQAIKSSNTTYNHTNADHYCGFPDASYSDGATATIKTYANVATGLSGLTIGTGYYMSTTGTVDTYANRYQGVDTYLGKALGTDKILIRCHI